MHDMEALEQAWKRYRFKRRILPALLGTSVIVGMAAALLFYFDRPSSVVAKKETATHLTAAKPVKPAPSRNRQPVKTVIKPVHSKTLPSQPVIKPAEDEKNATLKSPLPIKPDLAFLERMRHSVRRTAKSSHTPAVQKAAPAQPALAKAVPEKKERVTKKAPEKKSVSVTKTGKSRLVITSHKTNNTLSTLINRFNQTKNPKLATYIAQSFYSKGNYKETVRWSIIANSIEPGNEASWLLFAKAKVALKQKEDAVNALRTYLNQYSSKKIRAYLEIIEASAW